ncbi:hypothetical protein [Jeotgalibacillus sp. S-D1]|nr:hypothetical protein [Jeotgalibacillus sp. S-D1]
MNLLGFLNLLALLAFLAKEKTFFEILIIVSQPPPEAERWRI